MASNLVPVTDCCDVDFGVCASDQHQQLVFFVLGPGELVDWLQTDFS